MIKISVRLVRYSMFGLAAALASGLYGCAEEPAPHPLPPVVEITSGPIEGGTVSYAILIAWEGSDPDGYVDHFEYSVDPPPEFSEAEIEGAGEAITVEMITGKNGEPGVTRISKVVDGEVISFDWVYTREFSRHFRFATPDADSSGENGQPTGRFTGMHAVYLRAVDNDGLYSDPDKVAFTAETVAPSSEIVRPDISSWILNTGPTVLVSWEGIDPDGPAPDRTPTRFVYKLLRLDTLEPPIPIGSIDDPQILYEKGDPNWIDLPTDASSAEFNLEPFPGQFIFGIRAVDEAGAVEPFLDFGRNAFRFKTFANSGKPNLTLTCFAGTFSFRGFGAPQEVELPQNTDLECTLYCYADEYGETCNEYRWGIDIPDLDLDEYWTDWSTETVLPPILFSDGSIHVLYVEARDALGTITLGTLVLNIVEFPFDKDLLYVDDSFDDLFPRDNEHDGFWRDRIVNYGGFRPEAVGEHHAHLDNDRGTLSPIAPLLEDLGRYKIVLWECRGSGYNGATALLKSTETRPLLASYLKAGGKLWIGGRMTVAATMATASGLNADLVYPKDELGPGNFAWDFLKLHSSRVNNDMASDQEGRNNILKAIPFPGRQVVYPEMTADLDKPGVDFRLRGISHADAVFHPLLAHSEPDFRGTIDSLYVYGSTGVHLLEPPRSSVYESRLVALRWHDPDPDREHGRVQWFGFPLAFFYATEAQETFNRSMDWFREEQPPQTGLRGSRP